MASLVKDARSPFYWARFRDATGREFTRSTRERDRDRALEVALEMENLARGVEAPLVQQPAAEAQNPPSLRLFEAPQAPPTPPSIAVELDQFVALSNLLPEIPLQHKAHISALILSFLGPDISSLPIRVLTRGLIEGYRGFRVGSGAPKNEINLELQFLRSLCKLAMEEGRVSGNVAEEVPFEVEEEIITKPFSREQIQRLFKGCHFFVRGDDWRGVIALAIISGRSVFDIANLRSRDLRTTIDPPVLRFPCDDQSQYPGDDYDIHPLLVEYLFLRNLSKDPASFLFPSLASRPSEGPNGLEAEFVELIDVSGIERLSASGITADGCRRFEEYTASSLEHALPHEEVDLILRSAFQVRTKRQFPQEKIIPASQPASPQQSAPQPARWFPPSRGTRTI